MFATTMLNFDPTSIPALASIAAGAGILHTLAGPDHYLPLATVSRQRRWSPRRLLAHTAALGLVHCAVSVALVVTMLMLIGPIEAGLVDGLTSIAAWLVIGSGVALVLTAWRRHRRATERPRAALTLVALALAVGPCEVLLPIALAAGGQHGVVAAVGVSAVYTAFTIATMLLATSIAAFGLSKLRRGALTDALAGSLCAGCGVMMLFGF